MACRSFDFFPPCFYANNIFVLMNIHVQNTVQELPGPPENKPNCHLKYSKISKTSPDPQIKMWPFQSITRGSVIFMK